MASISIETAVAYRDSGLSCLPAAKARKRPAIGKWKKYAEELPTDLEVRSWFANEHDAMCIVCGRVSDNLECLDFDNHGELFETWIQKIDTGLLASLVIEQTPSGGFHVLYRCEEPVAGNLKLATGIRDGKHATLIETRGEGGLFLCSPSEGYVLQQGDFTHLPVLSEDERKALLDAARSLSEERPAAPTLGDAPRPVANAEDDGWTIRPGDDFAARGEMRTILIDAGWQFAGRNPDGNELWTRPGKDVRLGASATLKDKVFYVFSSNAAPFEPMKGYNAFQVFALLKHNGDFEAAAKELISKGYGIRRSITEVKIDLGDIKCSVDTALQSARQTAPFLPEETADMVDEDPPMNPTIVDNFLRKGEIMNIIASPKTGKTWLLLNLAISIATGQDWLGTECAKANVLYVDNELHRGTMSKRVKWVLAKRNLTSADIRHHLYNWNLRGKWKSIDEFASIATWCKEHSIAVVIVDAFYRAMPRDTDENSNSDIKDVYNMIDRLSEELDCAFILIHHSSKGNQSGKSVTDMGAGAGAQSRAADTHFAIRAHKERDCLVVESVARSFPPSEPFCVRKAFPLFVRDDTLNPDELEGKTEERTARLSNREKVELKDRLVTQVRDLVDDEHPMVKTDFYDLVQKEYDVARHVAREAVNKAISNNHLRLVKAKDLGLPGGNNSYYVLRGEAPEEDENEEDSAPPWRRD